MNVVETIKKVLQGQEDGSAVWVDAGPVCIVAQHVTAIEPHNEEDFTQVYLSGGQTFIVGVTYSNAKTFLEQSI